ncbi:unnamed protein product, partial [Polarella glacialis]
AKSRVYEVDCGVPGSGPRLRRTLEPHKKWQALLDIVQRTIEAVAAAEAGNSTGNATSDGDVRWLKTAQSNAVADVDDSGSDLEILSVQPAAKKQRGPSPDPNWSSSTAAPGVLEPRLVVVVPDDRSRRQLSAVLHRGPAATLLDALGNYLRERSGRRRQDPVLGGAPGRLKAGEAVLLAREAQIVAREVEQLEPRSALQLRQLPDGRPCHPRVEIVAADGPEGLLEDRLKESRPHAVVLFEPSLQAIRTLEVYCASAASSCVKREVDRAGDGTPALQAYLLVFEDSVEKYRFQRSLLQESEAIDSLITSRKHSTWRLDDGLAAADPANAPRSSRRGGGSRTLDAMVTQKVVVDMREFRSALPFMLYMRSLTIEPVTIPVGDYILSRDICVERKAIPDLIQSLASGRLFQQAQNMCQHYANPALLIEFDPGKSFALQNSYTIARREVDVGARDLLGKVALVVLHFPKLRMIWSPSQRFTADVFLKLKEGRYQPDKKEAAEIDAEDLGQETTGEAAPSRRSNSAALDVLRKLPGITPRNMLPLARRAGSLAGIASLSEEVLEEVMGKSCAQALTQFLHRSTAGAPPEEEEEETTTTTTTSIATTTITTSTAASTTTTTSTAAAAAEGPESVAPDSS